MIRILTQKQHDAILDLMREADQEIAQLKKENEELKHSKYELATRISELNMEVSRLRHKLNKNGLTWSETGIDAMLIKEVMRGNEK